MKYRPIQESIPLPGAILVTAFLLGTPGHAEKFDADSKEIEELNEGKTSNISADDTTQAPDVRLGSRPDPR